MLEIVIQNWDDLQKAVFDDVWDEKIMRYRANRIYRGAADKDWRLVPSLNRVCAHDLGLEQAVIRSFRKYGYADLAQYTGFWQLLPVAQHYGLPTRLLDWSYSPLVAAHFATEDTDAYDRDGAIWCIDATEVKHRLPKRLRKRLEEANCNIFSLGLLEEEVRDFAEMQALSPEPYALFFEPASMLDRIANQYALFSVVSDPTVLLSDILEAAGHRLLQDRHPPRSEAGDTRQAGLHQHLRAHALPRAGRHLPLDRPPVFGIGAEVQPPSATASPPNA